MSDLSHQPRTPAPRTGRAGTLKAVPVVVTGATGLVGPHAVAAFVRTSPEVRAYVRRREGAEPLRRLGVKVAVGEIEDVDRLQTVLTDAHTVCHLVGALDLPGEGAYLQVNLVSTSSVLEASRRAGIRRFLFLSYPGASPGAVNPFLRAKGLAEEAIRSSGLDHVIVRSTHIYGPGHRWVQTARRARWGGRKASRFPGSGRQLLAPVYVGDVAEVLAAADDRARLSSGTWGLEGPDRLTADRLVEWVAGRRDRKGAPGGSRLEFGTAPLRSRFAKEIWSADSLSDSPDAAKEFGVTLTPLDQGLAKALGEALEEPGSTAGRPGRGPRID